MILPGKSVYLIVRHQTLTKGENIMVKDLVCGMEIDPKLAEGKSEYQGQTYYFCSSDCKMAFDKEPEKYIEAEGHVHQHLP
jgi:Cu+-exporting ATPase